MIKPLVISIHWLGITGHFDPSYLAKAFHNCVFSSQYPDNQFDLYPFEYQGVSGRGYQHIHQWSGTGAYLYVNPLDGAIHSHLELRGNFCEAFQGSLSNLLALIKEAASEASLVGNTLTDFNPSLGKLNGTRLDIAFDHVPFTPNDQYVAYVGKLASATRYAHECVAGVRRVGVAGNGEAVCSLVQTAAYATF